jgi:O-antigen ligase
MDTFKNSIELLGTTLIGYYVVSRFSMSEFLDILSLFFGISVVLSAVLIFFAPGHGRMFWGSGPWSGIYEEKNSLGASMAIAIIVYLIQFFRGSGKRKLLAGLLLLGSVALLVGSDSATALLDCGAALIIGVLLAGCLMPKYRLVAGLIAGLSLAAVLSGIFVFGLTPDALIAAVGRSSTLTGRTDFWPYLVDAIHAQPLLGYGYDAFFRSPIATSYLSYYVIQSYGWSPYHAHNSFLQTCLDTGYVGLASLLFLIAFALVRSLKYFSRRRDTIAMLPMMIVLYLTLGSYTETYLGNFNTVEWILFVAVLLYPVRDLKGVAAANRLPLKNQNPV